MHILVIHQYFLEEGDPGGSRFNEMTRSWSDRGHQVTVIAGMVNYATGRKRSKHRRRFIVRERLGERVTVYRCHVSPFHNANFLGRLWAYSTFLFSSLVCGLFSFRGRPDVVLATSPPFFVGLTGLVLSRRKGAPLVFEVRDLWPESAVDTGVMTDARAVRLIGWLADRLYRDAVLVTAVTPALQRILVEKKGVSSSKIAMIPNGADFRLAEAAGTGFDPEAFRAERGWTGRFIVIYVGAHGVNNDLGQLIEVAELLKDRKDILFLSIGDGMQREDLVREAGRRRLDTIRFLRSVPKKEIFQYILAADVGVAILKKSEVAKTAYPNKAFDYMSCRKPILVAIDGQPRALVEEASCGRFVQPDDPADFASNVLFYHEHRDVAIADGAKGYEFARENFDREILADRYLEVLKRVGSQPQPLENRLA